MACLILSLSHYIIDELKIPNLDRPIIVFMDSTVSEAFMRNDCLKTKMKHIDVRQHWVRTMRDFSIVLPEHVSSESNIADLFTKIHLRGRLIYLRGMIMHG